MKRKLRNNCFGLPRPSGRLRVQGTETADPARPYCRREGRRRPSPGGKRAGDLGDRGGGLVRPRRWTRPPVSDRQGPPCGLSLIAGGGRICRSCRERISVEHPRKRRGHVDASGTKGAPYQSAEPLTPWSGRPANGVSEPGQADRPAGFGARDGRLHAAAHLEPSVVAQAAVVSPEGQDVEPSPGDLAERRKPHTRRPAVARPASVRQVVQRANRLRIAAAISSGASSAMKCPARVSRWSRSGAHAFQTAEAS